MMRLVTRGNELIKWKQTPQAHLRIVIYSDTVKINAQYLIRIYINIGAM